MKFQITLECGKQHQDKKEIVNECLQIIMQEVQRGFIHMNQQAVNAIAPTDNKPPVGFKPN